MTNTANVEDTKGTHTGILPTGRASSKKAHIRHAQNSDLCIPGQPILHSKFQNRECNGKEEKKKDSFSDPFCCCSHVVSGNKLPVLST